MRALLLLVLALPAAGDPGRAYATELGRRVLSRSDQIVEARVAKILPPFRGVSTARLEVGERLLGYDREKTVVLLYIEDYVAPDAFTATLDTSTVKYERTRRGGIDKYLKDLALLGLPRPDERITGTREVEGGKERAQGPGRAAPSVRLAEGEEGIFFLRRQSTSYALIGLVPRRDPSYESKLIRLKDVLAIEQIPALDRRAENAKHLFLEALEGEDLWLRANSAREVAALAGRYPLAFKETDVERLAALLVSEEDPVIRASLERAAGAVDRKLAVRYARESEEKGRERHGKSLEAERKLLEATRMPELRATDLMRVARTYGRASTQLLASFLADPEAIVREYAAHALAEQGAPSADPLLREALQQERDPDAAMAMVYALGVHADPDAVPVLAQRLESAQIERAAIHALARVGTPDARAALEAHQKKASAETQDLIASLIKEEFAERP
ncbi:MAG: HEAT repeat domain-containing protein [Planctomycetota bacterium]